MTRSPYHLAALLLLLAVPAWAQGGALPKPDVTKPVADTTPPAAISVPEIPVQAEAAQVRLDELRQVLPRDQGIVEIATASDAAQDTLETLLSASRLPGEERPTKRSLTDQHNEWVRREAQIKAWQKTVGDRTSALTGVQTELSRIQAAWRLTLTDARAQQAPPDVLGLVTGVLRSADSLQDTLATRLSGVIHVQSQLSRALATVQRADDQVSEQLASLRRNLLRIESPPLWRGLGASDSTQSMAAAIRAGALRTKVELQYFVETYRVRIYLHLASTLLLLFGVYWFRGKLEPHTVEQPAASARRILDHPFAGSVLVIGMAGLFFYPRAPISVYDLALLVTVPAVLQLLRSILPANLIRPASVATLLFSIQRLGGLFLTGSAMQRVGSLILSLSGAAGLFWLLRRGGELHALGDNGYARALRSAARLAAWALAVAAVSNLIGNVSLAQFLTSGILTSTYLLLVVLAAVRLFDGVFIVLARSEAASMSRFVAQRKDALVRSGLRLVQFLAALAWLAITLTVFDLMAPLETLIQRLLAASLEVGELHLSLGAALLFVVTVWVSVLVSRGLSGLLEVDVLSRLDMPRGLPSVIGRLTRYFLIALGFVFALAAIGLELTQLTIIGGALGVGIGFGLQNVVSNFVSGLILAFERPIREGDLIQLETLTGEVRRIGFRATIVRTYEGAEVIVPNASLISKDVVNWTLSDQQRRLSVSVGTAYGTDPDQVKALLLDATRKHPSVLRSPEPVALFIGFGDSALNFEVRFWTVDADRVSIIKSEVTGTINAALAAAGIEIPFPQRDLHIRSGAPPAPDKESA